MTTSQNRDPGAQIEGEHRPAPTPPARSDGGALLDLRTTVVLLLAVLVGIGAATLAAMAGQAVPAAVLVGGGATGGALMLFHSLVDRR